MVYRPDIDGIRAIAVCSVVIFHLDPALLPGGFIGVDIFFVISGYLITGVIQNSLDDDNFSISTFYERRVRRLLPALTFVVIAATLASHFLLLPTAYSEFGQSLVATGLFSSNILFFLEHGYFDGPSELKPLLHTWSLSVEEQFYIVFPVLLLLLSRTSTKIKASVILLSLIVSLSLCVYFTRHNASLAFYIPFTRAWELLFGSILFYFARTSTASTQIKFVVSLVGLISILSSFYIIDANTNFPGFYAILPVLATSMLLFGGSSKTKNLVSTMLTSKPFVFTGKISYSLYLIHWPVLVFVHYYLIRELSFLEKLCILFCIYFASVLCWRFVENPFRKENVASKPVILVSALMILSAFVIIGLAINQSNGFPNRLDEKVVLISKVEKNPWRSDCLSKTATDIIKDNYCIIGNKSNIGIAIIGDSHADALVPGIVENLDLEDIGVAVFTKKGCRPFINAKELAATAHRIVPETGNLKRNIDGLPTSIAYECGHFMEESYKKIVANNIKFLIIHARWSLQYYGERRNMSSLCYSDEEFPDCSIKNNGILFDKHINETLSFLPRINIAIVGPVPEYSFQVPDALGRSMLFNRELHTDVDYTMRGVQVVDALKVAISAYPNVELLDVYGHFCKNSTCKSNSGARSYYNDASHLSLPGSLALKKPINNILLSLDFPGMVNQN